MKWIFILIVLLMFNISFVSLVSADSKEADVSVKVVGKDIFINQEDIDRDLAEFSRELMSLKFNKQAFIFPIISIVLLILFIILLIINRKREQSKKKVQRKRGRKRKR